VGKLVLRAPCWQKTALKTCSFSSFCFLLHIRCCVGFDVGFSYMFNLRPGTAETSAKISAATFWMQLSLSLRSVFEWYRELLDFGGNSSSFVDMDRVFWLYDWLTDWSIQDSLLYLAILLCLPGGSTVLDRGLRPLVAFSFRHLYWLQSFQVIIIYSWTSDWYEV